jgi:hypothetical protein
MAWLESHQSLLNHHKTRKAARLLDMPRVHLCGHLHALWWWAIDYAEDGDVSAFDAADLADAAEYDGDAEAFVTALTECGPGGRHGFLERTDDGRLVIHDWYDYAGKLIERRKADRERKHSTRKPADTPTTIEDVQRTSAGSLTESTAVPYVTVTNRNQPTVTLTNQPTETKTNGASAPRRVLRDDEPYALVQVLLDETAADDFKPAPAWVKKQIGVATRLIEQGYTADKVGRCIVFMKSQTWRTDPFDLGGVEKIIGTWEKDGMPPAEQTRNKPRFPAAANGVRDSISAVDRVGDMVRRGLA